MPLLHDFRHLKKPNQKELELLCGSRIWAKKWSKRCEQFPKYFSMQLKRCKEPGPAPVWGEDYSENRSPNSDPKESKKDSKKRAACLKSKQLLEASPPGSLLVERLDSGLKWEARPEVESGKESSESEPSSDAGKECANTGKEQNGLGSESDSGPLPESSTEHHVEEEPALLDSADS